MIWVAIGILIYFVVAAVIIFLWHGMFKLNKGG